jgi:endonuclease G
MRTPTLLSPRGELFVLALILVSAALSLSASERAHAPDLANVAHANVYQLAPGITYEPNPSTGLPAWVAEWVSQETLLGYADRPGHFTVDTNVPPAIRARDEDYRGSGFDRGHLAASANWGKHRAATFNLANVAPQEADVNQRAIKQIEDELRQLVDDRTSLLIVTAPVYELAQRPRHAGRLRVPDAFVKAALIYTDGKPADARCYRVDNVPTAITTRLTIDAAESLLQRDLFSELPDDVEARLESQP